MSDRSGHKSMRLNLVDKLMTLMAKDAEALNCLDEICALRDLVQNGTSAVRQRLVYAAASAEPGQAVLKHLVEEFHADL
jgi:carboxylate-amine ligase